MPVKRGPTRTAPAIPTGQASVMIAALAQNQGQKPYGRGP
jgi:hypothetical protein